MTEQTREMQPATNGAGPLLQRDYWAVIAGSKLPPSGIIELLRERFPEFAPPELVKFSVADGCSAPIDVGDELDIEIRMAGECGVRVVHRDRNSLTLGTLEGHPEAGRITFGAYRNERGDVVFHIRSRARASGLTRYVEFLAGGDPMQTNTWVDFINALSMTVGSGIVESIRVEQREVEDDDADADQSAPTFLAKGD
ncbi:MAG TPA: DUF1990 family protein [Longimicrobiales bacterium]